MQNVLRKDGHTLFVPEALTDLCFIDVVHDVA